MASFIASSEIIFISAGERSSVSFAYFLKEGRLSVSEDNGMLSCEICGCAITTGRYCVSCKSNLERELTASLNDAMQKVKKPSSKGKMHINLRDR